jgi:ferredoxin
MPNYKDINKIVLICFSGTGNTAFLAGEMQAQFKARGKDCDLIPLEEITLGRVVPEWGNYDLAGIAHPVHAFDAPRIVFELLPHLPRLPMPYFLFKTAGSLFLSGGSSRRLRLALAEKGWLLRHEAVYHMPSNLAGTTDPGQIRKIVDSTIGQLRANVQDILAGRRAQVKDSSLMRLASGFNRIETYGTKRFSARWEAGPACTFCGLCVRNCPTGNISFRDGKIGFSRNCVFCLRCQWNCPVQAIGLPKANWLLVKKPYRLEEILSGADDTENKE